MPSVEVKLTLVEGLVLDKTGVDGLVMSGTDDTVEVFWERSNNGGHVSLLTME